MATLLVLAFLAVAAVSDVAVRRIPNAIVLLVAATGVVRIVQLAGAVSGVASLAIGVGVLAALLAPWRLGLVGGGDAKLAAAAACAVGSSGLLPFALATALAGGALAVFIWVLAPVETRTAIAAGFLSLSRWGARSAGASRVAPLPRRVPFGAAIAAGAAYVLVGR